MAQKEHGMSYNNEKWKPVTNYEGLYEVSNLGRVKSLNYLGKHKEQILKQNSSTNGYLFVRLYKDGMTRAFKVHRLVYEAFNGEIPQWIATQPSDNRLEINHINEIKTDNRLENLELITHTKNIRHSKAKIAISHYKRVYQYTIDLKLVKEFDSVKSCKTDGFNPASVSRCCKNVFGKSKNIYKGYIWSCTPIN